MFFWSFFSFFRFPSFWANPRRHAFYCSPLVYYAHSPFTKNTFFHELLLRKVSNSGFIFVLKIHPCSWLFRYKISHRFVDRLFMKMTPKMDPKSIGLDHQKSIVFATLSFMLILYWIGPTFGSLLAPFGPPLAPFGLPLAPFWLPLARFWIPLGAPGLTLAHPCARFSRFGDPLATFFRSTLAQIQFQKNVAYFG